MSEGVESEWRRTRVSNSDTSQHYTPDMETHNLNRENNGSVFFAHTLTLSVARVPQLPTTIILIYWRAMTPSFLPKNAFPLPAPLTATLVALGLDDKTAASISKVYLSSALTLKGTYEREYSDACKALLIASDSRGYSSKELRAKLLAVSVTRYSQALSKWMEEAIRKAEASILKKRRKYDAKYKVSACHSLRRQ